MKDDDWQELTEEIFNKLFDRSAVTRTGLEGLKRNIRFVSGGD
jgi:epoxyqueuosine reductase